MCVFGGVSGIFPPFSNPGYEVGKIFQPRGFEKKNSFAICDLVDEFGGGFGVWCGGFGVCESLVCVFGLGYVIFLVVLDC